MHNESSSKKTENRHFLENEETAKKRVEQVQRIKDQAHQGGLKFEVYLPPSLAEWVLEMVEEGRFLDPAEAVFVFMGLAKDIDTYEDLSQYIHDEILRRRIEDSKKDIDSGKYQSWEEVKIGIEKKLKNKKEPAVWEKIPLD